MLMLRLTLPQCICPFDLQQKKPGVDVLISVLFSTHMMGSKDMSETNNDILSMSEDVRQKLGYCLVIFPLIIKTMKHIFASKFDSEITIGGGGRGCKSLRYG